jgi:hypothetical protein
MIHNIALLPYHVTQIKYHNFSPHLCSLMFTYERNFSDVLVAQCDYSKKSALDTVCKAYRTISHAGHQ